MSFQTHQLQAKKSFHRQEFGVLERRVTYTCKSLRYFLRENKAKSRGGGDYETIRGLTKNSSHEWFKTRCLTGELFFYLQSHLHLWPHLYKSHFSLFQGSHCVEV